MAKLHTLQAHGSGGLVSMRNTNTAAGRAAHAPGDDPLARALKELNSRALRVGGPSGHKCAIPSLPRRGVIVRKSLDLRSSLFVDYMVQPHGKHEVPSAASTQRKFGATDRLNAGAHQHDQYHFR